MRRVLCLFLSCVATGSSVAAAEDDFNPFAPAAVPAAATTPGANEPTDVQQLIERLSQLEGEVARLRAEQPAPGGAVAPASAEYLPPPPLGPGITLGASAPAPAPAPPPKKYPFVNVNGVFQADAVYFSQETHNREQLGDIQDGADFRRARLSASGSVAENVNYFFQMDFGFFGRPTFTDVWAEVKEIPLAGTVRAGQWKQPFSLEVPTSFRYQTFMERSVLFQSFEAFRHIGIGYYNNSDDEIWTWAVSAFRVGQDQYGDDIGDAGGWSTAGRLTHLFYYEDCQDAAKRLDYLHWGASYWVGDPANNAVQYRTIPEIFVGAFGVPAGTIPGTSQQQIGTVSNGTPPFVDTGAIATNTFAHLGAELLYASGPFSVQTEFQFANVSQIGGPSLQFWGYYAQWMFFLTGESKPYLKKVGQIDRIIPLRSFARDKETGEWGPGAWEFAMRLSHIDLNDDNIHGGRLTDLTAGVNWYLNPYSKVQFNYIRAMVNRTTAGYSGPTGADIFGVRWQVDF